jgi:hypothetical protein
VAEYCKARLLAARAGVTMALLALVGAVPAWARNRPTIARNSITSSQVKNGSLEFKDFKHGQILSAHKVEQLFKAEDRAISALSLKWTTLTSSFKDVSTQLSSIDTQLTSALAGIALKLSDVYQKEDADARFLHKADTAANSQKLGGLPAADFVQGDGSVFTGSAAAPGSGGTVTPVLTIPGVLSVSSTLGAGDVHVFRLLNLSGGTLEFSTSAHGSGSIAAGQSTDVDAGSQAETVQLLPAQGTGRATTLTLSLLPAVQRGDFTALAQALVGQAG